MDLARRRNIGGWAALGLAVIVPVLVAAGFASNATDPFSSRAFLLLESVRGILLALAAWGLAPILTAIDQRWSLVVMLAGVGAGAGVAALDEISTTLGVANPLGVALTIAINLLSAAWLIGTGVILGRSDDLRRIGLSAQLGGAGTLAVTMGSLLQALGIAVQTVARPLISVGQLSALFTILFVIRIWGYAVRGRTPAPGRI